MTLNWFDVTLRAIQVSKFQSKCGSDRYSVTLIFTKEIKPKISGHTLRVTPGALFGGLLRCGLPADIHGQHCAGLFDSRSKSVLPLHNVLFAFQISK